MLQVRRNGIGSSGAERESVTWAALTVLSTGHDVEMMVLNVEFVGQGIGGSPAPACTNLVGGLVGCTHVALVVDLVDWQIGAPCPAALVIVDLAAIGQAFDRLDLYETGSIQAVADALVVGTLTVHKAENGVAGV